MQIKISLLLEAKECLEVKEIQLRELNILGSKKEFDKNINIKVRSTGRLLKAKINLLENSANVGNFR
jgi:tRNA-specific 2-thiouridylase